MKATKAIENIFSQAGWFLQNTSIDGAMYAVCAELENYTVNFAAFNDDEIYIFIDLLILPKDELKALEIVKKACAMQMQVYLEHKINVTIEDNKLRLELVLQGDISIDEMLMKAGRFLDDVDYFYDTLIPMTSSGYHNHFLMGGF